jgi:hypothetical protein
MKKRDLTALVMIGISAGLVVGGCQQQGSRNEVGPNNKASADEQMSPDMQAFYSSLSPDAQNKFMQLDAQHKMMAVEMANQDCKGQNKCATMGGCKTDQHDCKGKNGCKGQGGAPIKDPNKAVEVQFNNQMLQRQRTNSGMGGGSTSGSSSTGTQSGSQNGSKY